MLYDKFDSGREIGFDTKANKNFLTISPDGVLELLKKSEAILDSAPSIDGWIFYSSKPTKKWKLLFDLLINDDEVRFNANEWQYVLYKYPDNVYDVVIKVPESYQSYEDYFYQIGDIALTVELGEAFVINYINDIDLVFEFNEKEKGKEKEFSNLKLEILM